jgi:hypothetical protein
MKKESCDIVKTTKIRWQCKLQSCLGAITSTRSRQGGTKWDCPTFVAMALASRLTPLPSGILKKTRLLPARKSVVWLSHNTGQACDRAHHHAVDVVAQHLSYSQRDSYNPMLCVVHACAPLLQGGQDSRALHHMLNSRHTGPVKPGPRQVSACWSALCYVALLACMPCHAFPCYTKFSKAVYPHCKQLSSVYSMHWRVESGVIEFGISLSTSASWVGLGISEAGGKSPPRTPSITPMPASTVVSERHFNGSLLCSLTITARGSCPSKGTHTVLAAELPTPCACRHERR